MPALLLDTHAFLWLFDASSSLTKKHRVMIEDAAAHAELHLSAISFWEIAMLASKKRIELHNSVQSWLVEAVRMWRVQTINLGIKVASEAYRLPADFQGDPADRMIVASSKLYDLPLMTADKLIHRYAGQGAINVIAL